MKKIKLLLVEDDVYNCKAVSTIIGTNFPEISIVDMVDNVASAKEAIAVHHPQLLILDIHLVDGTSFDLLRQVGQADFKVVFMSAYQEYALEALQFSSVDFIFKPFDVNDLVVAVDKALDELKEEHYQLKLDALINNMHSGVANKQMVIQSNKHVMVVNVKDIVWAKAIVGGSKFYFADQTDFFVANPLRRYEALLNAYGFVRCHPHHLVNMAQVKYVDEEKGKLYLKNGMSIDIEPRKVSVLRQRIKDVASGLLSCERACI